MSITYAAVTQFCLKEFFQMPYLAALLCMTFGSPKLRHASGRVRAPLAVCGRVKVLSCYQERLGFLLFEEGLAGSHRDVVANGGPLSLISPGELAPLF